jgi:hypothetical protein
MSEAFVKEHEIKMDKTANYHPESDGLSKQKMRQIKNKLKISYNMKEYIASENIC